MHSFSFEDFCFAQVPVHPAFGLHYSRVEGLEVLKVLPQRLQEQPELAELEEVGAVLVVARGLVLGEVEGAVDGRLAVEQLLAAQHVAHAFVSLE